MALPTTITAIEISEPGAPDVLKAVERPMPQPGNGEILIKIAAAGVNRVLTMDLHAQQIQGFFDIPVDHLYARPVMMRYLRTKKNLDPLVVCSPDVGGLKMAEAYAQALGVSDGHPAHEVEALAHFVGRGVQVADGRACAGGSSGRGVRHQRRLDRSCPAWYRNVRVGANSPSL